MLTCLPLFLNLLSPRDTWWFQGVWVQLASSRAVLPSPSKPWTLNFYLFLVLARIRTKEVTQCFLGCHQLLPHQACLLSLLALSTVQSSPFVQTHRISLPIVYPAQDLVATCYQLKPSPCWSSGMPLASPARVEPSLLPFACTALSTAHILFPTEIDRESGQANQ